MQDEAICVADARLRKDAPDVPSAGVYTYTGSHSKTIVFGLITLDGEGFFQRYGSFTGKEFVEFLKAACDRFGVRYFPRGILTTWNLSGSTFPTTVNPRLTTTHIDLSTGTDQEGT